MKLIKVLIFVMVSGSVAAQNFLVDSTLKTKYPYVYWENNALEFYGESPAFQKFFQRLDALYKGESNEQFNFFHIGGSHIQADIYSHRLRRYLQNMSPSMKGGRGMIFPYTLAGTNNPWNYKVDSTGNWHGKRNSVLNDDAVWGMEGITALTSDSIATVRLSNRSNLKYRYEYDQIRVYHNTWDTMYRVEAVDSTIVDSRIVVDSLGYTEFNLNERHEEFEFRIVRLDSARDHEFMLFGIDLRNDDPGVIYHSIGVNGASFNSYKRCELFEEQLSQFPPDLFIISVGTNDTYVSVFDSTEYENNYEDFIKMILRINPDAAIVLTVPNDSYYRRRYANPHTVKAARAIVRLAEKYDMATWNFYEIMGGFGSSQDWHMSKLMPRDRIHFTGKGYDIKGDLFLTAFYEAWDSIVGRDHHYLYHTHIDPDTTVRFYSKMPDRSELLKKRKEARLSGNNAVHVVRSGESLGVIAEMYSVSVNQLMYWNGLGSTVIYPGQKLQLFVDKSKIPPKKQENKPKKEVKKTKRPLKPSGNYYWYTIQDGDTLWDIAISKGTSVERIQELNPGLNPGNLKIGQKIRIKEKK